MRTWLLMIGVLLCVAATAQGQHVTVDFQQTPLREALAELKRQSGANIGSQLSTEAANRSVDLRMEDAPLRAVLRALCRQLGCHFVQSSRISFSLREGPDRADACPTARAGPYTIRIRSVKITDALNLSFVLGDENPLTFHDQMSLALTIEADDIVDCEAVIGVDRTVVAAAGNAGQTVASRETGLPANTYDMNGSWYAADGLVDDAVTLDVPPPEAASLRVLEGDIVVHDWVREQSFEFPLEGPHQPRSAAGHTFVITNVQPEHEDGYYVVETEWRLPWTPRSYPRNEVYLVAADGTRRQVRAGSGTLPREGDDMLFIRTHRFTPREGFVPEKLVFEFLAKSRETHRVHFRLENIPLPPREG